MKIYEKIMESVRPDIRVFNISESSLNAGKELIKEQSGLTQFLSSNLRDSTTHVDKSFVVNEGKILFNELADKKQSEYDPELSYNDNDIFSRAYQELVDTSRVLEACAINLADIKRGVAPTSQLGWFSRELVLLKDYSAGDPDNSSFSVTDSVNGLSFYQYIGRGEVSNIVNGNKIAATKSGYKVTALNGGPIANSFYFSLFNPEKEVDVITIGDKKVIVPDGFGDSRQKLFGSDLQVVCDIEAYRIGFIGMGDNTWKIRPLLMTPSIIEKIERSTDRVVSMSFFSKGKLICEASLDTLQKRGLYRVENGKFIIRVKERVFYCDEQINFTISRKRYEDRYRDYVIDVFGGTDHNAMLRLLN